MTPVSQHRWGCHCDGCSAEKRARILRAHGHKVREAGPPPEIPPPDVQPPLRQSLNQRQREIAKERIKQLVQLGGVRFPGRTLQLLWGRPCVYLWLRGEQALYVGMSQNGIERPFDANHQVLHPEGTDELLIWPVQTREEAVELERLLIEGLRPTMNQRPGPGQWLAERLGVSPSRARSVAQAIKAARDEATSDPQAVVADKKAALNILSFLGRPPLVERAGRLFLAHRRQALGGGGGSA